MQIPIISGIYTNAAADLRVSYPVNLVPTVSDSGISQGYLRPADGIVAFGVGPGIDRGGIRWNNVCYRVMGSKLVSIASDGTTTTLGDVGAGGQVRFDYSFDRLAINSGTNLYYWDGAALTQVTDADLGAVLDVVWVDGYFMTTDGANLVVTELTNPLQVNPLKYGSSEADPDPVKCLLKIHNEVYVLNRHTIEVFDNVGGNLFPFQRIEKLAQRSARALPNSALMRGLYRRAESSRCKTNQFSAHPAMMLEANSSTPVMAANRAVGPRRSRLCNTY